MEIKSLPTDNLYKFITLFSIALMLASAYASVSVYNTQLKTYKELKEAEFKILSSNEKIPELENRKKFIEAELSRTESDKKFYLSWTFSIFMLSIAGSGVGFFLWWYYLQRHLDEKVKLETEALKKEES